MAGGAKTSHVDYQKFERIDFRFFFICCTGPGVMSEKCKIGRLGASGDLWEGAKISPKKPPSSSPMGNFGVRFSTYRTAPSAVQCERVEGAK